MLFCIILTNLIPTFHILHLPISILLQVCGSMPYDDSNIRRMIRDQTERRVGFSHSRHVTEAARNLIHSILESDVSKRFVNKTLNYYTTILKKQNVEVKACVRCPVSHVASVIPILHVFLCQIGTRGHFWTKKVVQMIVRLVFPALSIWVFFWVSLCSNFNDLSLTHASHFSRED